MLASKMSANVNLLGHPNVNFQIFTRCMIIIIIMQDLCQSSDH